MSAGEDEGPAAFLASPFGYDAARLEAWRRDTPPHQAVNALVTLLRENPPRSPHRRFVLPPVLALAAAISLPPCYPNGFLLFLVIAALLQTAYQFGVLPALVGRRAAIALARFDDERAIPYLADAWQFSPGREGRAENRRIAEELTRLLTETLPSGTRPFIAETLRAFLQRHRATLSRGARDLTDSQADVFLGIVRYIAANGTPADKIVLGSLARQVPAGSHLRWVGCARTPNASLIREVARMELAPTPPPPVSVSPHVEESAVLPAPVQVVARLNRWG